jgi:hypothetical protein
MAKSFNELNKLKKRVKELEKQERIVERLLSPKFIETLKERLEL